MRTLWNGVSFLAVVNLLAMAMVAGWLWKTGRLDQARLLEVKALLATPIALETQEEAAAAEPAGEGAAPAPAGEALPMDSIARNRQASRLEEQELLLRRRLADEQQMLASQIESRLQALEQRRADVEQRERALDDAGSSGRQERADAQFIKAVRQVEALPPAQAKKVLLELVSEGQMVQAVAYLDAMQPRAAAKVLREFKSDSETALATDLIEHLRRFGVIIPAAPETAGEGAGSTGAGSPSGGALGSS